MSKILILHGPNLNLLGKREPTLYGNQTLAEIDISLQIEATKLGHNLNIFQSNGEHELINMIQAASTNATNFIIFNPGAFTHTSIALRDALLAVNIPFIEVHLSNPYARETFRQVSYFSDIAQGLIVGLGGFGYILALQAANQFLKKC